MIKINVILNNISWKKYIKNPNIFLEKKINSINKKNKQYRNNSLICTLLLSGTNEIRNLNKKFRKKNKSTDVLSFPFYSKIQLKKIIKKDSEIYLGDVIINLNKIKHKNDKKKFEFEFNKLWIHGLVHLFGYMHKKDKDYYVMQKIEKKYLKFLN
tara:strand:+ start:424 stop:888 length:465 start_codon:yes stop_codon:yes gene_type:complete